MQINATTQREYQGGNQVTLTSTAFTSNEWATFLQWRGMGCRVKKGERGTHILKVLDVEDKKGNKKHVARNYVVFNREQVEKA